jgi:hypothetical protein
MRKAGFKIDIQPLDWGTLSQHRNNKDPVDYQRGNSGGWNLFIYSRPHAPTTSRASPATRSCSASAAAGGSTDQAARARLADQIQARAYQAVRQRRPVEAVHGCADECLRAGGDDGAGVGAGDASSWTVLTAPLNISGLHDVACRRKPLAARRSTALMRAPCRRALRSVDRVTAEAQPYQQGAVPWTSGPARPDRRVRAAFTADSVSCVGHCGRPRENRPQVPVGVSRAAIHSSARFR